MKLVHPAKFAAGAGGHTEPTQFADKYGSPHSSQPVVERAVVLIGGRQFYSEQPESAAHATKINADLERFVTNTVGA